MSFGLGTGPAARPVWVMRQMMLPCARFSAVATFTSVIVVAILNSLSYVFIPSRLKIAIYIHIYIIYASSIFQFSCSQGLHFFPWVTWTRRIMFHQLTSYLSQVCISVAFVCCLRSFLRVKPQKWRTNTRWASKMVWKLNTSDFLFGGPEGCRWNKFETTRRHTHDSRRITGDVQQRRGPAESGEVDMIKGWYVLDDHPQDLVCDCQVDLEEAYEDDWTVCNQESVVNGGV